MGQANFSGGQIYGRVRGPIGDYKAKANLTGISNMRAEEGGYETKRHEMDGDSNVPRNPPTGQKGAAAYDSGRMGCAMGPESGPEARLSLCPIKPTEHEFFYPRGGVAAGDPPLGGSPTLKRSQFPIRTERAPVSGGTGRCGGGRRHRCASPPGSSCPS